MKLISSLAFALFVATVEVEGFGPATPVFGGNTVVANGSGMTMRVSKSDMRRRQLFNEKLEAVGAARTKESLQENLLSKETAALISNSNWKVRQSMIRKVRYQASKVDAEVESTFGVPLSYDEQTKADMEAGAKRREERAKQFAAGVEAAQAEREAREARKSASRGTSIHL